MDQMVIELAITMTAKNCRGTQTKHRKAKRGYTHVVGLEKH